MDAQEQSLDDDAQLRVYRLEQVAVALKCRRDPSSLVSRWVLDEATFDAARIGERSVRGEIDVALRRIRLKRVAFLEAERVIAPISSWIRRNLRM